MLSDAGASWLVTTRELLDRHGAATFAPVPGENVIVAGEPHPGAHSFADLLATPATARRPAAPVAGLPGELHRALEERFDLKAREWYASTEVANGTMVPFDRDDLTGSGSMGLCCPGRESMVIAGVIPVPDEDRDEEVKAIIVLTPGATVTASDVIEWLGTRLAPFKIPRYIEFRHELPHTESGKIAKSALRAEAPLTEATVDVTRLRAQP